jgi:hypothetical protein
MTETDEVSEQVCIQLTHAPGRRAWGVSFSASLFSPVVLYVRTVIARADLSRACAASLVPYAQLTRRSSMMDARHDA